MFIVKMTFCMVLALIAALAAAPAARAQSNVDQAKVAWEKAKADLAKAQDAYDKATGAYIAAIKPPPAPAPAPGGPPSRAVVFAAPKSEMGLIRVYQVRLTVDGAATGWTYLRSTDANALTLKAAPTKSLSYEMRSVRTKGGSGMGGAGNQPAQTVTDTICSGSLTIKGQTAIAVDLNNRCTVK